MGEALLNINDVSEGIVTPGLKAFLEPNVPAGKAGKKAKVAMGVSEHGLGKAIQEQLNIACVCNDLTAELLRGARAHTTKFLSVLKPGDLEKAQLGLAHSYSRSKVKFDVNRADKHIIQSIAILDTLDKDINTFAMRVREWYSWHFPELVKIISDNYVYARLVRLIRKRESLTAANLHEVEAVCMDATQAQEVLDASKHSMGMDISEIDLLNIHAFAERVIKLAEYRTKLQDYLHNKMGLVAPNLQSLIGDAVAARLISHAGSLTNLAKYPASTVQILGAEKALFRALKTKGNTPKYGLIFHSTFIGRAGSTNKGRISRYLANKCSIASRIDCFTETPTSVFGEKLKDQVEERLKFYETGDVPRKNVEVMSEALIEHNERVAELTKKNKKKKKKRKHEENGGEADEEPAVNGDAEGEPPKKKKKKKHQQEDEVAEPVVEEPEQTEDGEKKKKKKKKNKDAVEEPAAPMEVVAEATEDTHSKKKKKKKKVQEEA